jgi:hypothetical protein
VIESALSIIVAGVLGYWHAFYAWVVGLSVVAAACFLASHKTPPRITRQNGDAADSVPLIWKHFAATGIFIAVNVCFLAADFTVYFFVAWLH